MMASATTVPLGPSATSPRLSAFTLVLPTLAPAQEYTLTTHATLRLGSLVSETATRLRVRKSLRQPTPTGGGIFDLTTLARVQTPAEGAERLTAELTPLLEALVLETDATGYLVRVRNLADLRQRWAGLLPGLRQKYRGDSDISPDLLAQLGEVLDEEETLVAVLRDSPEYSLLFPSLYGQPYSATVPVPGTASLARFVGEIDLPLRTETLLEAAPLAGGASLKVAGAVDASYRADEVRQALCRLTDQPNLDTRVAALHTADYVFGPSNTLLAARRHTRADIPGIMSRQLTVLLQIEEAPTSRPTINQL